MTEKIPTLSDLPALDFAADWEFVDPDGRVLAVFVPGSMQAARDWALLWLAADGRATNGDALRGYVLRQVVTR